MTKPKVSLKTDGAVYFGDYNDDLLPSVIFFDFESCASHETYQYINVYGSDGKFMGYLELIGGDYE